MYSLRELSCLRTQLVRKACTKGREQSPRAESDPRLTCNGEADIPMESSVNTKDIDWGLGFSIIMP